MATSKKKSGKEKAAKNALGYVVFFAIGTFISAVILISCVFGYIDYLTAEEKFECKAYCDDIKDLMKRREYEEDGIKKYEKIEEYEVTWVYSYNGKTDSFTTYETQKPFLNETRTIQAYIDKNGELQETEGVGFSVVIAIVFTVVFLIGLMECLKSYKKKKKLWLEEKKLIEYRLATQQEYESMQQ